MGSDSDVKERLISAAFNLLRDGAGKRLVQTKVAAAAGVLQSHLTYYFPKRADLIAAAARRTLDHIAVEVRGLLSDARWPGDDAPLAQRAVAVASFVVEDKGRTQALLGLALEALDDESVRELLIDEARFARQLLGAVLQRPTEHEDVDIALAVLHGLAIRHLLRRDQDPGQPTPVVLRRLAAWLERAPTIEPGSPTSES